MKIASRVVRSNDFLQTQLEIAYLLMYKFAIQIRLCVYWKECKTWWRTMHAKPQRTGVTRRFFFARSMRSELSSEARTVLSHEISSDRNEANEPIQHCSSFCSKSKACGHAHLSAKTDCTRAYKCLCAGLNETTKASGSSDTVHNGPTWQI